MAFSDVDGADLLLCNFKFFQLGLWEISQFIKLDDRKLCLSRQLYPKPKTHPIHSTIEYIRIPSVPQPLQECRLVMECQSRKSHIKENLISKQELYQYQTVSQEMSLLSLNMHNNYSS